MSNIEGNKLIEIFVFGEELIKHPDAECKYHTNWNWLMPVVKKACLFVKVDDEGFLLQKEINYALCSTFDTEIVFMAVIKFIEWYNKQNKL